MRFDIKTNCDHSEYFINRINDDGSLTLVEIVPVRFCPVGSLKDADSICPPNCAVHKEARV